VVVGCNANCGATVCVNNGIVLEVDTACIHKLGKEVDYASFVNPSLFLSNY
jgi:hypothetical protein